MHSIIGQPCHWGTRNEGGVCGCWQTTSKPSIHKAPSYGVRNCSGKPGGGNPIGNLGNLQNPSQMLSHKPWNFISFQGWSSEGALSWWLVPLVLPFTRKRGRSLNPLLASSPSCTSPFNERLGLKNFIQMRAWMEVEISFDVKFFKLLLEGDQKP